MFEHLSEYEPEIVSVKKASITAAEEARVEDIVDAKANTVAFLESLGVDDEETAITHVQKDEARKAFTHIINSSPQRITKDKLEDVKTPAAVKHLVGMLTAYDWQFIDQAQEIRGYVVAQLLELTKEQNAHVRLKALQQLGKVTEIGLYTDKVEVVDTKTTEEEVNTRLEERLRGLMNIVDINEGASIQDIPQIGTQND